jgi:hypothetical protein
MAKAKVLNVLKNMVGEDNVRIELSKIYIFVKSQNAFVFFKTKMVLESYQYDNESGWHELENDISEYGY